MHLNILPLKGQSHEKGLKFSEILKMEALYHLGL
jgi:hypothetical protein